MMMILVVAGVIAIVGVAGIISTYRKMCPHHHVVESHTYDAICKSCGKNLGFIDAWQGSKSSNL